MSLGNEHISTDNTAQFNVCFINPALLPDWFWLPTAYRIEEQGHKAFIPTLRRGDMAATVEDNIDIIEDSMKDYESQYVVVLSRGVEFGVRYLDRLAKKDSLSKIMGWMVISSVGPRGYEVSSESTDTPLPRHTQLYMSGLSLDEQGLEMIDRNVAETAMLHAVDDERLRSVVLDNLIHERPLSKTEITTVPQLEPGILPLAWYIGTNDKVDNTILSAGVAKQRFDINPTYTRWGHVGPLSHTDEVAEAVIYEAQQADAVHRKRE